MVLPCMVDIHCHILPEVDDGSKSWEMTVEMCALAARDGITHIVATPHADHQYAYSRELHEASLDRLRLMAPELVFSLGCDFHFSYDNLQDALEHHNRYTIGQTDYLLLEFSNYTIPPNIHDQLFNLHNAGFRLIVTHPERNPIIQHRPRIALEWAQLGCVVQVTSGSLTGGWGSLAKKTAEWLLKRQAVHVLATDAHDTRHRPPNLSSGRAAAAKIAGEEVAKALVEDNPHAIVENKQLPWFPEPRD
jgi:protein-tyrosine phosphatase